VRAGDPEALSAAVRSWLTEGRLREQLRSAARGRRATLPTWPATSRAVAGVLSEVAA
jgi:glycosyltransferase involved in cell wall biosynthesis